MISSILNTLEQGIHVMRSNSRLLLVGILLFVFPLLFVWITQSFFDTAYSNIDSSQKQRVSMLHDSLQVVLTDVQNSDEVLPKLIEQYLSENADITKIRVVEPESEGTLITYSFNPEEIGTYVVSDSLFKNLPLSSSDGAFIYPTVINDIRTWQVFSSVDLDGLSYIIFSEHSFELIDSIMLARQQLSYLGLSAIFLFLIGLAYWINKQVQWEKLHQKVAKQLEDRDLFSNMIAHEFRAPLTAIKGYASFLEESETLDTENKRFANTIRMSAERLVVLVNDFLEVARLQSGKLEFKKESVDVRDVLAKVTADLQITANKKNLQLTYEPSAEPIVMQTDETRLQQVITNIVSNSVKYTDSGEIELECQKKSTQLTIRIKDTGTGISAEDQKKLFAPFTRVGEVDESTVTGSGLGMWITKQFVSLLDGDIGVESIKGVGTHIVITFRQ
jgi:signal transduction histidine kinase